MNTNTDVLSVTKDIVTTFLSGSMVPKNELPEFIRSVYKTVSTLAVDANPLVSSSIPVPVAAVQEPVVVVDEPAPLDPPVVAQPDGVAPKVDPLKSVFPDHIVCLTCGGDYQSLKRHLGSTHKMTPEDYRTKWGLRADYPMVTPNYSEQRSKLALESGLGRKDGGAKRGRKATA